MSLRYLDGDSVTVDIISGIDTGPSMELFRVPIGPVERGDRTGVVEEGIGIGSLRLERELLADFFLPIPVIVDVDLIEDTPTKLIKVWSASRTFQGNVVSEQR